MRMNGETTLSTIPRPRKAAQSEQKVDGSQIDWDLIRKSVLESSAKLAWMDDMPEEALKDVWSRRAAQVAKLIEEEDTGEQLEIVTVRLGQELYGLDAHYIYDIRKLDTLTRVPRVPDWIAGVTNLRGTIISVVDLQRFLGLPRGDKGNEAEQVVRYMVVAKTPAMELGFLVDEVLAVETLPKAKIQESGGVVRGIQTDYMHGIVIPNGSGADTSPRVILDVPALLNDKRLIVHEDII